MSICLDVQVKETLEAIGGIDVAEMAVGVDGAEVDPAKVAEIDVAHGAGHLVAARDLLHARVASGAP